MTYTWVDVVVTEGNVPDGTSCDDGAFCTVGETCHAGACTGGAERACDDSNSCTTDSCDDINDACVFSPIEGCGPCWTSAYLVRDSAQASKFCKCAEGTYGYKAYSYVSGTKTANKYIDSANNLNWGRTTTTTTRPISKVKCMDNVYYSTSANYYY